MAVINKPPYFSINEIDEKVEIEIFNYLSNWYYGVNTKTKLIVKYNEQTGQYFECGTLEKYAGFLVGEKVLPIIKCQIAFNGHTLDCPFTIYDLEGVLPKIFDQRAEWYDNEVKTVRERYFKIKENDYREQAVHFRSENLISYSDISDENFLNWILKEYEISVLYDTGFDEKNGILYVKKVSLSWFRGYKEELSFEHFVEYAVEKKKAFLKIKALKEKQNTTSEQRGFDLGLDEEQLKSLYKELTDKTFLSKNTIIEHFINAFNGKVLTDYKPLEWIDLSRTRKEPNARTLFEFLYLLKLNKEVYDTSANNSNSFYRIIERVFKPIPNLTVKNPYKVTQKTPRHILLKSIIESIKS